MAHRFNTNTAIAEKEWDDLSFVLVDDIKPSPRIKIGRAHV